MPCLADLAVALAAARVVTGLRGAAAGRTVGIAILALPLTWLVSAWWGQWDSVSLAVLLAGVLALRSPRRMLATLGVALLAWAVMTKPPLALAVAPLVLWRAGRSRRPVLAALAAAVVGVLTVQALGLPFDVGLPGTGARWTVVERLATAARQYDGTSLGATNVWTWASDPWWAPDSRRVLGVPVHLLGTSAVVAWCLVATVLAWRARRIHDGLALALWWGATALAGWYLLATRCHERYVCPAAVLAVVAAATTGTRRARLGAWVLGASASATVLVSLAHVGEGEVRTWTLRLVALGTAAGSLALLMGLAAARG